MFEIKHQVESLVELNFIHLSVPTQTWNIKNVQLLQKKGKRSLFGDCVARFQKNGKTSSFLFRKEDVEG